MIAAVARLLPLAWLVGVVAAAATSPAFRVAEVRLAFNAGPSNPWAVVNCSAHVRGPAAATTHQQPSRHADMVVPLFFDGNDATGRLQFAFRLAPDVVGTWTWQLACPPLELAANEPPSGTIGVVAAGGGRGGAVASPHSPQQFEREDGSRWTPLGYEIDWLWALGMEGGGTTSISPVESALDVLSGYGFNHLLVSLYANYRCANTSPQPTHCSLCTNPSLPVAGTRACPRLRRTSGGRNRCTTRRGSRCRTDPDSTSASCSTGTKFA